MTDRYAVIGNPIAHSKSPALHAAFARQCGQDIRYEAILGPLDGFRAAVEAFRQAGGRGMNVTVPFKVEALALADTLTGRARLAQAVNTLRFDADGIFGDNTDGIGLVNDIQQRLGFAIGGKRVLILGAGGAARGSVLPLAEAGPARLVIVNRTQARAEALREQFAGVAAVDVEPCDGLFAMAFDPWLKVMPPTPYIPDDEMALWRLIAAPVLHVIADAGFVQQRFGRDPAELARRIGCFAHHARVDIADSGHNTQHDQPERLAAAIEAFCGG